MYRAAAMPQARQRHFIREWRKHRMLTLEQLAERVEVTHATLSRIERGLIPYNQDLLERLAEELRTEPASLIMRNPEDTNAPWTLLETVPPEDRPAVVAFVRNLQQVRSERK